MKKTHSLSSATKVRSQLSSRTSVPETPAFIYLFPKVSGPDTLNVVATGSGQLADAVAHFAVGECRYTLIRTTHIIDRSETVKFIYVEWTCETIAPQRKAVLTTHKPQVTRLRFLITIILPALSFSSLFVMYSFVSTFPSSRPLTLAPHLFYPLALPPSSPGPPFA